MATITAIVHTKNSAAHLATCLASLTWCDDIWVVDMGSTDETLAIAKKYKASMFVVKSDLPYADPIRNQFLAKVKTDWTLIVDSDEEVPKSLAAKIKEVMMVAGINGYAIPRKNIIFGAFIQHTGFWPDYIIRLMRTGYGKYPPEVHGQPTVEGKMENLPAQEEYALVHHHYRTIEEYVSRLNVYTSLEVEKLVKTGDHYSPLSALQAFFNGFHTRFFAQEGYKDGSYGFTLSLLQAVYPMLAHLKAWEKTKKNEATQLEDVEAVIGDACSGTTYWVSNEELKKKPTPFNKVMLQIRRKLSS